MIKIALNDMLKKLAQITYHFTYFDIFNMRIFGQFQKWITNGFFFF